jgi:hypothetical protein
MNKEYTSMNGNEQGYFLPVDESGCEVKMVITLQPRMVGMLQDIQLIS